MPFPSHASASAAAGAAAVAGVLTFAACWAPFAARRTAVATLRDEAVAEAAARSFAQVLQHAAVRESCLALLETTLADARATRAGQHWVGGTLDVMVPGFPPAEGVAAGAAAQAEPAGAELGLQPEAIHATEADATAEVELSQRAGVLAAEVLGPPCPPTHPPSVRSIKLRGVSRIRSVRRLRGDRGGGAAASPRRAPRARRPRGRCRGGWLRQLPHGSRGVAGGSAGAMGRRRRGQGRQASAVSQFE